MVIVGCGQTCFEPEDLWKSSMVVTPNPHYAAQLFHEQHLQNKFGIQIC